MAQRTTAPAMGKGEGTCAGSEPRTPKDATAPGTTWVGGISPFLAVFRENQEDNHHFGRALQKDTPYFWAITLVLHRTHKTSQAKEQKNKGAGFTPRRACCDSPKHVDGSCLMKFMRATFWRIPSNKHGLVHRQVWARLGLGQNVD